MRHAILGTGGIGGLLGAALSHAGAEVLLLVRPSALADFTGHIHLDSVVLGKYDATVEATTVLDRDVDVVWVTTKATGLSAALALAPADQVGNAAVIPLLNGIDHLALLRRTYPHVVAGAIRVESERSAPFHIRQSSPFLSVELAGAKAIADELVSAGIPCTVRAEELTLLWDKLALLAPLSLTTTAFDAPVGAVRNEAHFRGCRHEALAVAEAEGAHVDREAILSLHAGIPEEMRTSMQKDATARRPLELDAIADPILRGGIRHGIDTPSTQALTQLIRARTI